MPPKEASQGQVLKKFPLIAADIVYSNFFVCASFDLSNLCGLVEASSSVSCTFFIAQLRLT